MDIKEVGSRQYQLLSRLLHHKSGLTINQLSSTLKISRTATQQHVTSLESKGFVEKGYTAKTAGRPVQTYKLTGPGLHLFPKQYAWFSELLLGEMKHELGSGRLETVLRKLGEKTAQGLFFRLQGKSPDGQLDEVIRIMAELGYEASLTGTALKSPAIQACNCVYHDLAQNYNEVCAFDVALISSLLKRPVVHQDCMAKGDPVCSFEIGAQENLDF
jgi:predicted ArsR family transcriptional regulator